MVVTGGSVLALIVSLITIIRAIVPLHNQLTLLMSDFHGTHGRDGLIKRIEALEDRQNDIDKYHEYKLFPTLESIERKLEILTQPEPWERQRDSSA